MPEGGQGLCVPGEYADNAAVTTKRSARTRLAESASVARAVYRQMHLQGTYIGLTRYLKGIGVDVLPPPLPRTLQGDVSALGSNYNDLDLTLSAGTRLVIQMIRLVEHVVTRRYDQRSMDFVTGNRQSHTVRLQVRRAGRQFDVRRLCLHGRASLGARTVAGPLKTSTGDRRPIYQPSGRAATTSSAPQPPPPRQNRHRCAVIAFIAPQSAPGAPRYRCPPCSRRALCGVRFARLC